MWGNTDEEGLLKSMELSMCDGPMETVKYILMDIWCMLDWIFQQNSSEIHFLCIELIN